MNILILSAYFEPENVGSLYLAKSIIESLAEKSHHMILNVPKPTRGVSKEIKNKYKKIKHEKMYGNHLQINRYPMFDETKNTILRALRYFLCHIMQFILGFLEKDIDEILVFSTPPTQGLVAAILSKLKKIPVVYCLQDIFPDSLVNSGFIKNGSILWKLGRLIENFTYRYMNKIIVISNGFKGNLISKGVPEQKIVVIPNWADQDAVVDVNRHDNILFERFNLDKGKYYVTYTGNIGFTQSFGLVLDAAKELSEYKDLMFVLIGEGAYKPQILKIINDEEIHNVSLFPYQSYDDISHVISLGDVGLVISKKNVGDNSVPSKTWNIMSASRPIIASFDLNSELCSVIKEADCGICVSPDDLVAFKEALLFLYNNRSLAEQMGKNGRKYVLENLSAECGTSKYVKVLENLRSMSIPSQLF